MYAGVPIATPVAVSSSAPAAAPDAASPASITRATPKSVTTTRGAPLGDAATSTLSGLKSRWTTPARCAATSPRPARRSTAITSAVVRGAASSHARSVPPSISSIARYTRPSTSPTSCTVITAGSATRASIRDSRTIRAASAAGSPARSGRISFSATDRSSASSCAAYTTPMPPAPSTRVRR
jgi:hypothetical protein